MKTAIILSLTNHFESNSHKTENGVEFWLARDLQQLLGYDKWDNFLSIISKAKITCETSGHTTTDHFVDMWTANPDTGSQGKIPDNIMLTRYASYLIAQNGDPRKEQIAFAQNYFALQTRKFELIEKRMLDSERLAARHKLSETEKKFSQVIFEQTGSDKNFGLIRSKGDKALFGGYTTREMKYRLGIPKGRALADFQPTILLRGKDFATAITMFNSKQNNLSSEQSISQEHITNNRSVRAALIKGGITPELLPAEEDFKKVERQWKSQQKRGLKNPYKPKEKIETSAEISEEGS